MSWQTSDVTYRWHRLALAGGDPSASRATLTQTLAALSPGEFPAFAQFLIWHKIAALWHERLEAADLLSSIDPDSANTLRTNRIATSAMYLAQRQALAEIDRLFERHSIPYVAIKGASVREYLYHDAALRPASDIDILIAPAQRLEAARILIEAGFRFERDPENIDWEATFHRGAIAIDLHWNILRSGRTRCNLVLGLLARRQRQGLHWTLSPPDTVVLMLIHPAFTKYVTSPNMAMISIVDFLLLLRTQTIDWDLVASRLNNVGLKTAAWTVLTWFRWLVIPIDDLTQTEYVYIKLQPGPARRRYLHSWIKRDLATRWLQRPLPIQLGFTLVLHDRPFDAARAVVSWRHAHSNQLADPMLQLFQQTEALSLPTGVVDRIRSSDAPSERK